MPSEKTKLEKVTLENITPETVTPETSDTDDTGPAAADATASVDIASPQATGSQRGRFVPARASAEIERQLAAPLAPGLYLVATPIGNLADITVRALTVLARADVVYCEDTRHSRTLVAHYGIGTRLEAYHEHNGARERPRILARLAGGERVALISDAGTPLVSDPGYKLVREAIEAGHRVESLPGPSAIMAGLTSSGLPTDAFLFAGFLPVRSAGRRARAAEFAGVPATLVFYEAPSRIAASLADLAAALGDRPAAVARELTKRFETIVRGQLPALAAEFASAPEPKGEFVILVGPPLTTEATDVAIEAALVIALETMTVRDAAKSVSDALNAPKSRVYDLAVALRRTENGDSGGDDGGHGNL